MNIKQKKLAFIQLGKRIEEKSQRDDWDVFLNQVKAENGWFTSENIHLALQGIQKMLQEDVLNQWLAHYPEKQVDPQKVGIVMAGNIPAVGFHDLLCTLMSGHQALIKLSSKDSILIKSIAQWLIEIESSFEEQIIFAERLNEAEAYIATGSNNSARYFEYYFSKKPHIIRQNRNSCAILTGGENEDDFNNLTRDLFCYFGLGCRNVSKLYVPADYDWTLFWEAVSNWEAIAHHHKYTNNYDYYKSIYLLNQDTFSDNGFLMLKESESFATPVSILHYETYNTKENLSEKLKAHAEQIQCIVARDDFGKNTVPFGQTQFPKPWDYADNVDTMEFLLGL